MILPSLLSIYSVFYRHFLNVYVFSPSFFCSIFFLDLFLRLLLHFFYQIHRVSLHQLIVKSCASSSNNLLPLSYLMPVFSANLFRLFYENMQCIHIFCFFSVCTIFRSPTQGQVSYKTFLYCS